MMNLIIFHYLVEFVALVVHLKHQFLLILYFQKQNQMTCENVFKIEQKWT